MSEKRELSRAETIRRRRSERAAKELQETKARALKPMVKVTSRTPTIPLTSAMPKQIKKQPPLQHCAGLPEIPFAQAEFLHAALSFPKFRARLAHIVSFDRAYDCAWRCRSISRSRSRIFTSPLPRCLAIIA
jgi:hypothetical protein